MKKLLLLSVWAFTGILHSQSNIDTLAFQDFEVVPATPVWSFTGPVIYNSGYSTASAAPANSPIGIGGSRAWETTTNSGGLVLDFANTTIPSGYDSVRVRFNLAAMNLAGPTGGPDDLDYVLAAYSIDGGTTYSNRLRIRGAVANNCFWAYSATAVGKVYYLPATETMFQPLTSGLQTTMGYSTCEIVFLGTITQLALRITGRSSSSTDTWLVDNLVMTGENSCSNSTSSITTSACGTYISPSGMVISTSGTYLDTITNTTGCDSVITINLTINSSTSASISPVVCGNYTAPSGAVYFSSGIYLDTISNSTGCDSMITLNLTVNNSTNSSLTGGGCGSYTLPSGAIVTSTGIYLDTIANSAGCDSIVTANVSISSPSTSTLFADYCFSFTTPSGNVVTTSGVFNDTIPNIAGCDSVITIDLLIMTVDVSTTLSGATLMSNASNATYQWIDCGNNNVLVPGETNQSFSPAVNGNYAVIVTQGFCTDTSACVMVLSVEVSALVGPRTVLVSPNPTEGQFTINFGGRQIDAAMRVVDIQGKLVAHEETQNGNNVFVDISAQPAGIYFLELRNDGNVTRTRIVKF